MIRCFLNFLYGSTCAQFESHYSVHESVSRLAEEVKPSNFHPFSGQCAVGTVTEKEVLIHRKIPFVRNSWKPVFVGSFEADGNKAILKGQFRFSNWTVASMSFVFLFITLWTVLVTISVTSKPETNFWFPLFGVAMLGVNIAMFFLGKWFSRNDVAWLSKVISRALHANRGDY
jgi:hypothetical protein